MYENNLKYLKLYACIFLSVEQRDNCKIDQCVDASSALLRFLTYALHADAVKISQYIIYDY